MDPYELPAFDMAAYEQLLAELEGTPVLVNIWASWCAPCRDEAPISAAHAEFGDRVQFLGLDILDERGSARASCASTAGPTSSVFDGPGAIRDGLGILGQPATLFYDASGELVRTWSGPVTEEVLKETSHRSHRRRGRGPERADPTPLGIGEAASDSRREDPRR